MGFFTKKHETDSIEVRNSEEDDEDFHAIFAIDDLVSPDVDEEEDTSYTVPKNTGIVNREISDEVPGDTRTVGGISQENIHTLNVAILWNNKGVVLSKIGDHGGAIEAFNQALKIDPHYFNAWNNKGVTLSRLGKYSEAIEAYDHALRINTNYSTQYEIQMIGKSGISIES